MQLPKVSFIVPLYNESATFPLLVERLNKLIDSLDYTVEVVLIDDGSKDDTPQQMATVSLQNERFQSVFLSRNFGHQTALTAGIAAARGTDALMIIDGDLQDPPELLPEFYKKMQEGYDVVYAVRRKRKENWLKRSAYHLFYRFLKSVSYIEIPLDSGDFALISRRVADIMNQMPEESRFLRGMRTWIGFNQIGIEYERSERAAGESKYSLKQLFGLAYNGIFNFSEFPIKFITRVGLIITVLSSLYLISVIIKKFFFTEVIEGFTALLSLTILFGGIQLMALGIIGEYVLRIFFQSKNRPIYIVKNKIIDKNITP